MRFRVLLAILLVVAFLAACAAPVPTPTPTPRPTATTAATSTPRPTSTPGPTNTPSPPTATNTVAPTVTATLGAGFHLELEALTQSQIDQYLNTTGQEGLFTVPFHEDSLHLMQPKFFLVAVQMFHCLHSKL